MPDDNEFNVTSDLDDQVFLPGEGQGHVMDHLTAGQFPGETSLVDKHFPGFNLDCYAMVHESYLGEECGYVVEVWRLYIWSIYLTIDHNICVVKNCNYMLAFWA